MTFRRWQEIERVYHAALERPPTTREQFLTEACKNDSELRREVESLLAHETSKTGKLDQPAWVGLDGLTALDATANVMPRGTQLGPYKIEGILGKGGMGEVYRARDTKLKREVAIKIIPDEFSRDPDRLGRFQREAELLASLNHPNIGAIYGLEEANGVRGLVLELIEGDTLGVRIQRSPVPVKETLAIARQIADALDAAHEKGIVHRDLKPANIKITPGGVVKVLDFGLAKAVAGGAATPDRTQSPTITVAGTGEGVILGTAAYMSPEQARGARVDKRTDIWAFGCVVYEMLTGRAAFARGTISDTIAAILDREPDWDALHRIPPRLYELIRHCLQKDPKLRLRDIGDARGALDDERFADSSIPSTFTSRPRSAVPWSIAGVAVAALVALLIAPRLATREPPVPSQVSRTTIFQISGGILFDRDVRHHPSENGISSVSDLATNDVSQHF